MKIKSMNIANFCGIKGKHRYDFPEVIALCAKNGSGKTSFINALRFVLTGYLPEGDVVTHGEESAAVQIETEAGNKYIRQKFAQKSKTTKCFFNGKQCSAKDMNKYLEDEIGVPVDTAKFAATGELLTSLSSQQFGELLLKYLPEQLTIDIIESRINGITENQKKIIESVFENAKITKDSEFGSVAIDAAYASLVERRKILKQTIAKKKAVYDEYASVEMPSETPEEIQEKIDAAMKERDAAVVYATQKKAYNDALYAKKQYDARIEQIKKSMAEISVEDVSVEALETEIAKLSQEKIELQAKIIEVDKVREAEIATGKQLYKAVVEMQQNAKSCPFAKEKLGADIPCTTDFSAHTNKFVAKIKELKVSCEKSADNRQKMMEQFTEIDAKLMKATTAMTNAKRKADLQNQLEGMKELEPKIPEAPVEVKNVADIDAKIKMLTKSKVVAANKEKLLILGKEIKKYEAALVDYEFLVLQFSPKGAVKESITMYYLDTFTDTVNEKAKELLPGMKVKFISHNGVLILVDIHGDDTYLEYSQLSGGEQACVTFLLLDLLSTLSGFRMIVLDELSVLDSDSFTKLLNLVINKKDDYDHVILSAVDSKDYKEVLEAQQINVFKI